MANPEMYDVISVKGYPASELFLQKTIVNSASKVRGNYRAAILQSVAIGEKSHMTCDRFTWDQLDKMLRSASMVMNGPVDRRYLVRSAMLVREPALLSGYI